MPRHSKAISSYSHSNQATIERWLNTGAVWGLVMRGKAESRRVSLSILRHRIPTPPPPRVPKWTSPDHDNQRLLDYYRQKNQALEQ